MTNRAPQQGYPAFRHVMDEWQALGVSDRDGLALTNADVTTEAYLEWAALGLAAGEVVKWARVFDDADEATGWVRAGFTDPWTADRWRYYMGGRIGTAAAKALDDLAVAAEDAPYLLDEVTDAMNAWGPNALLIMPGITPDPVEVAAAEAVRDGAIVLTAGVAEFTAADAVLPAVAGLSLTEVLALRETGDLDWDRVRLMAALSGSLLPA